MTNYQHIAEQMYAAYCQQAGGLTFDGKPLPSFSGIGLERQTCWKAAAEATHKQYAQPQADARDAGRWSEIGKSIERACGELPEDFEINIHLENGAGTASLLYPSGEECKNFPHDDGFAGVVNAAIDAAIAASKEKAK